MSNSVSYSMIGVKNTKLNYDFLYRFLFFIGISIPALLIMSSLSTPLFPQRNADFSVFTVVGNAWSNGLIPYKEIFDHKGPVVFLIYRMAEFLAIGKWGIWIFQLFVAVLSFELIYRCGEILKIPKNYNLFATFVAMICYFCYVDGGGTVEEWSLPFQLYPLFLSIKYFKNKGTDFNINRFAFITGFCFGVVSLIRINNNCIICGIVLGILINLIRTHQFSQIIKCAPIFLVGLIIPILPFIIYFYFNNALSDFWYSSYTFNILYKQAWPVAKVKATLVMLLPCLALPVTAFLYDRKYKDNLFFTFTLISLITFAVFLRGMDYGHYFLMTVPITALAMQQSYCLSSWLKFPIILYLLIPCYLFYDKPKLYMDKINNNREIASTSNKGYSNPIIDDLEFLIPKNELNSVYTFGNLELASYLYELGEMPKGKFFYFQDRFVQVDPKLEQEIINNFKFNNPIWIISNSDLYSYKFFQKEISNYIEIPQKNLPPSILKNKLFIYRRAY